MSTTPPNSIATSMAISLAGATLQADLSGALLWPDEETMIVADLHLEKGSSYADRRRPQFLPPYDTRATIERLEALIARHAPRRVVCLGDSVHDSGAEARMDAEDQARIAAMTRGRDWIWIAGNHDPEPPAAWGGAMLREAAIGGLVLRHQARPGQAAESGGEVSGHFHPTAAVSTRAARVTGRCFAVGQAAEGGLRLVLPAFGAYAGGLNVLDPAIACLFAIGFEVLMLGRRRMFTFSSRHLRA